MEIFKDAWKESEYGKIYAHVTDMLPVDILVKFREYDRKRKPFNTPEEIEKLRNELLQNGIESQLMLIYNPNNGYMYIGEGNHRLAIAIEEGITHLPARIARNKYAEPDLSGVHGGAYVKNPKITTMKTCQHINSDLKPSDVFDINDFYDEKQFERHVCNIHYKLIKEKKYDMANQFLRFVTKNSKLTFNLGDDFNNELKQIIDGLNRIYRKRIGSSYHDFKETFWLNAG